MDDPRKTLFELGSAFDELELPARTANVKKRIRTMHAKYGHGPAGATCKGCLLLLRHEGRRQGYIKCRLFGVSRSDATDWRASWPACGRFQERRADDTE